MTLDEIRVCNKEYLSPSDVAPVLNCKPYTMNLTIRAYGTGAYPFEVFLSGNRVRISKKSFLEFAEKAL